MNIWNKLPKPFFVLAPMDGVTDSVFRRVIKSIGGVDIFVSEFTNVSAFCSEKGRHSTESRLFIAENEGPVIAQIWGNKPEHFRYMSKEIARSNKFQGIDINLGCPDKSIVRQGSCSALIGQNNIVSDIIESAKSSGLPISIKTRLGRKIIETEEWFSFLLSQNLSAITVHGRTAKELSKTPAHWDEIAKVVEMRNRLSPQTIIIGNGDVRDREHGEELARQSNVDGIMIGRGVFSNPFAFETTAQIHPKSDYINLLKLHLDTYQNTELKGSFSSLKKFFKAYIQGWPGANSLRSKLMECKNPQEVLDILEDSNFIS